MKKVKIITLATYETNMGFRVDIVHNMEDKFTSYEAYLYYKSYGVKDLMFGLSDEDTTLEEFCDIVMGNLAEYIRHKKQTPFTVPPLLSRERTSPQSRCRPPCNPRYNHGCTPQGCP